MFRKMGFPLLLLLIMLFIFSGCSKESSGGADSPGEIRIGVTGPFTGPAANSGIAMREGMEVALEEWNEKGGIEINGEKLMIKVFYEDNQSKPEEGVSTAEKLFNNDKVHLLIGDAFASSVTMSIMDLAPQYEIPILSGQPVSGAISEKVAQDPEKYKYFWKGNFSSAAYGATVYETITSLIANGDFTPKNKTVAFVVEDTDYGRSNADAAAELFEKDGWETVAYETVPLGHTDFYPQLSKMNSLKPDILISCFTALSSGVALVKQFDETQATALHMAIYYPLRPEFLEQAPKEAEGLLWTPLTFDPTIYDHHKEFADKITKKFDTVANSDHAQGYDVLYNALTAIEKANSLDPEKIVEQLAQLDRQGVMGRYVFNQENHEIIAGPDYIPVPASQIQDGKNTVVWPENVANSSYRPQPWLE